ncbi:hypothetical protein L1267_16950 [Pseudoalteromonas sp. OFAV1]|jgi:hypothetical protein|uniref:hypothetical protein n=1 Tax=Pseudoalteromonas sp. OFAV1 TaxID=2908892 RepID=UPI001F159FD8|nr:hypothetical protein [Pseudoalteromonas sp. OFAV1]MCF2902066.1 hypothetical protein [Pseudoalteromonas sp. OFAV1]
MLETNNNESNVDQTKVNSFFSTGNSDQITDLEIEPSEKTFDEIIATLNSDTCNPRLLDNLSYTLEPICFSRETNSWNEFRVLNEVKRMTSRYGYESLEDWSNHLISNCTVYIHKDQAVEQMQETLQDNLANTVITKAKEIHPLFAMIVSNNIDKVMSRSAFTRAINSDNPTQELESFLKSESRVQLRLNKFFSYEQWENELKKTD